MMPQSAPKPLHLIRLAQGSPGEWVALPGGGLSVVALHGKMSGQQGRGWLLCLEGEALIDLPNGEFVRLRMGEGYSLTTVWQVIALTGAVLLLVTAQ